MLVALASCNRAPAEPPAPVVTTTTVAPDPPPQPKCPRPLAPAAPPAPPAAKACPADPGPKPMLATTTITFENGAKVDVEIARSDEETSRGLMYRTSMPEDRGMIFAMDRREHTFWMRNTCIPLDMLFIDRDGTVVGVEENVPTLSDAERTCGCLSTHVLEVNAGWTRRHGVAPGMKVKALP